MRCYELDPEVAGGWGESTWVDTSVHPPLVAERHFAFEGWLGDELLRAFPRLIATGVLGFALQGVGLTGFRQSEVRVSTTQQFQQLFPGRLLPEFHWLPVDGGAGVEDFGRSDQYSRIVSERALRILWDHTLEQCALMPYGRQYAHALDARQDLQLTHRAGAWGGSPDPLLCARIEGEMPASAGQPGSRQLGSPAELLEGGER